MREKAEMLKTIRTYFDKRKKEIDILEEAAWIRYRAAKAAEEYVSNRLASLLEREKAVEEREKALKMNEEALRLAPDPGDVEGAIRSARIEGEAAESKARKLAEEVKALRKRISELEEENETLLNEKLALLRLLAREGSEER